MFMKLNNLTYLLFSLCLFFSCGSGDHSEENVVYIHPEGKFDIEIHTKEDLPKRIKIDSIYKAFCAIADSDYYAVYLEGNYKNYEIWVQGKLPRKKGKNITMETGLSINGKNLTTNSLDLTYQAYNVKIKSIKHPVKMGDLLELEFSGWFFEKKKNDALLNIENAFKRIVQCNEIKFQLVEDIVKATSQIE